MGYSIGYLRPVTEIVQFRPFSTTEMRRAGGFSVDPPSQVTGTLGWKRATVIGGRL